MTRLKLAEVVGISLLPRFYAERCIL